MANIASRPGFIAGLLAVMLLGELAAARLLFDADREGVTVAGVPWRTACAFKERFGIPCPACGMTRSVVLSLHGDVSTAAELNPGGPVIVFGLLYFSAAMIFLAFRQRARPPAQLGGAKRFIQWSTAAVGMMLISVVCVHWTSELIAAHESRASRSAALRR
jgi:hypothetical protein